jgi:hypothetical protein
MPGETAVQTVPKFHFLRPSFTRNFSRWLVQFKKIENFSSPQVKVTLSNQLIFRHTYPVFYIKGPAYIVRKLFYVYGSV